ncbi:hypothetical protein FE773_03265 [Caminibacter mediatlanticus TB-2]|uniref:Periplasmic protein n=1 Tax=Caminibacter mediatlanticus TB-2 TaxID=391592 RepID=A0ABX5V7M5_9BACT|nr:hypothetical protein [Caminibacter mediatlanticus]QCT94231.1 hypothetical protein FE773_03265 [Caminibacter mediatlanticus TB-2]
MKKLVIFFLVLTFAFAKYENLIINLIGNKTYIQYKGLIQTLIKDNNVSSIEDVITILKENGLIELFFEKPKNIHPTFIFVNNNPIFNTKTLYNTLNNLGYYYFYPIKINKKNNIYKITLEMQSNHYIDPLNFIKEIKNYGCNVTNIKKTQNYTYYIDCQNEYINAPLITQKTQNFLNIKGEYWFNTNNFKKALIKTSKYDNFHPYIAFYDKNLNLLNIITNNNLQRQIIINIPKQCLYIKIRDNFTKENIKRGIFIKGLE